ncbi:MAG: hypothetical protein V9H25_08630 [Candidatus Competibacter sp.]
MTPDSSTQPPALSASVDQRGQDQNQKSVHLHVEAGAERARQTVTPRQPAIHAVEQKGESGQPGDEPAQVGSQPGLADQSGHQRDDAGP